MSTLESYRTDFRHARLQGTGGNIGHLLLGTGRSRICTASILECTVCDDLSEWDFRTDRHYVQDDGARLRRKERARPFHRAKDNASQVHMPYVEKFNYSAVQHGGSEAHGTWVQRGLWRAIWWTRLAFRESPRTKSQSVASLWSFRWNGQCSLRI